MPLVSPDFPVFHERESGDPDGAVSEATLAAIEDDTYRPGAGLTVPLAKALDVTVEDVVG